MAKDALRFEDLPGALAGLVKRMEAKVPYAAALAIRREGTRVTVSSTQTSITPEFPSSGVVLSAFNGESLFEASSNDLEPAALEALADELAAWCSRRKPAGKVKELDPGPKLERRDALPCQKDPLELPLRTKLEQARTLQAALQKAGARVRNATAVLGDLVTEEVYVNRHQRLSQRLPRVDEMIQVVVAGEGRTQMLWDGVSRGAGWEATGFCKGRVKALVADAERLLTAPRLEAGVYEVVAHPDWSGILAHEAFGHGTETDMYLKDRAKGREYMNKRVGSDLCNIVDDPTLPGQAGTFFFDHEGSPARRTQIVQDGVLRAGMTDLYSSAWLGYERSANGRRESWERKAYARMTNTFFSPGSSAPKDLFASVEDGIYLKYASNGMEDPQGWGIQCEGLWGQRIRKGKLTDEVYSPVIMTGYVPDILASISMVADDLEISGLGYCGKGHKEYIKNTTGGPHLKFKARLA